MYEKVSFERAKAIMDAGPHVLLDVRDEDEYITGHAAGAILLPLGELDDVRAADGAASRRRNCWRNTATSAFMTSAAWWAGPTGWNKQIYCHPVI